MRIDRFVTLCSFLSLATGVAISAHGQAVDNASQRGSSVVQPAQEGSPVPSLIVDRVDDARVVRLRGNTHPMARAEFDKGPVDAQLPMERMTLVLKRSPDREVALEAFMARQLDPASPDFHRWLKPEEFGKLYGPSDSDISAITSWLQNHGFSVDNVTKGRTFIEFSGTAGLVQEAFHTEIHRYNVRGEEHIANSSDPSIPEALSPVVTGVLSLHNFLSQPMHKNLGSFHRVAKAGNWAPDDPDVLLKSMFNVDYAGTGFKWVAPYDFATIYNVLPLWSAGIDGTGQTIAIAGRGDLNLSDVATFRSSFGLPANVPTVIVNGADPVGASVNDRVEALVDVEWAGAVAKAAKIKFVTTASVVTDGVVVTDGALLSAQYIVENNVAPIMSFSFGACELALGTSGNAAFNLMWQQGAAEGITEFVASGDQGSASCDAEQPPPYLSQFGLAVSGTSSTPYNVAVGGTDFQWPNLTGTYWNSANNSTNLSSALSYIPEVPWNGTCASDDVLELLGFTAAGFDAEQTCNELWTLAGLGFPLDANLLDATGGSGGVSSCTTSANTLASCSGGYAKPAWQTGTGVPADSKRDVPDVSLFASNAALDSAYVFCDSEIGPCDFSQAADAAAQGIGGTSVSSPAMAGIMALVLQKAGGTAQGLANPEFYQLASQENLSNCNSNTVTTGNSCVFYDITSDNNKVPCASGTPNCSPETAGDAVAIMSGYDAAAGYDLTTGLGSVNAYNLVNAWTNTNAPAQMISPTPGSTLTDATVTFNWTTGPSGATGYFLWIGTSPGTSNIANIGELTVTSKTLTLPTNGATIYVRLWTVVNGSLEHNDYTYTESNVAPATMTSPANMSTLTGATTTFNWTTGSGAVTGYFLWIGTSPGTSNIANIGELTVTTRTVTLPTNGATIYVRLWTVINGSLQHNDYTYTESTLAAATMTSPANLSTLSGATTTFNWTAGSGGVSGYFLWIGTSPGTSNIANIGELTVTTRTVTLPTNGATIYVRLWTVINGSLQHNDYTYTESTAAAATMTTPVNLSTLTGATTTFNWTAGSGGVSGYFLWIGTSPGTSNIANIGELTVTNKTVTLPTNGTTIYVRLWTVVNGNYLFNDYTYTEF